MDSTQLKTLLENSGCQKNKADTKIGRYTTATWNNFTAAQVANRSSASWKTAQYIIVNDCKEENIDKLINIWRRLTAGYNDQYLIVYVKSDECYWVYDSDGKFIDTDSILEELIKRNKAIDAATPEESPADITSDDTIGENIIYYGVPGSGKSYAIDKKCGTSTATTERVVFHPDYTYADFIGQILPVTIYNEETKSNIISYEFVEGPFSSILKRAWDNIRFDKTRKHFYFIIEEINRGNASAIFGDIFQLLDRRDPLDDTSDVPIGTSKYGIINHDIANLVFGDKNEEIRIPSNLTIIASMNTSDQNVFTLDTAFQRRWKMSLISNDFDDESSTKKQLQLNTYLCGTELKWKDFAKEINKQIIALNEGSLTSEDNRLGVFFATGSTLTDTDEFSNKVLMYLWNDAFKYSRDVFPGYSTLEDLIIGFREKKFGVFNASMFDFNINNEDTDDAE